VKDADASMRFEKDGNGEIDKAILMNGFLKGDTVMKIE
jgi:hypothetical protein